MKTSGVYKITNMVNGEIYIGSSVNIVKREWVHFSDLSKNIHENNKLQRSYNKYGKNVFLFGIIEIILRLEDESVAELENRLLVVEQYYLDNILHANLNDGVFENNFNLCREAGTCRHKLHTEETKRRISVNNARYWLDKKKPQWVIDKISQGKRNNPHPYKEETKIKMIETKKRNGTLNLSEETKYKISIANKGKLTGTKHETSAETRFKISEGLRKYWNNKKKIYSEQGINNRH